MHVRQLERKKIALFLKVQVQVQVPVHVQFAEGFPVLLLIAYGSRVDVWDVTEAVRPGGECMQTIGSPSDQQCYLCRLLLTT